MRYSLITLSTLSFLLLYGGASAQQTFQNPPLGPSQHAIQNQAASRAPAAQLQYQNAIRAGQLRAMGGKPNVDVKNRNPLQQVVPDPNGQFVGDQSGNGFFDDGSGLLGGGSSYASGGGGGVVTAAQGAAMGIADGIRSIGEANKNTAAGEVLHERARSQEITNDYQGVQTYFQVRQLNRQQRAFERGPMPTQDDLIRYSQSRLPERLSLAALDRHSGAIHWPAVLMRPEFDDNRAELDQIFQGRSIYNSGLGSESYVEIQDAANRMLATLQDLVRDIDPTVYVQARKFITGLGYEGRFVVGQEPVAMAR